jgi:hypothetical protein
MSIAYTDFLHRMPNATDKGNYIVAPCPFHNDNSPSLLIFPDGYFHCLAASCSVSGTFKMLWNKLAGQPLFIHPERRISYNAPEAIKDFETREELAYQAHLHLTKYSRGYYLESRGLADAIEIHELGYWRGWYTFPVWNRDLSFHNVIFRTSPPVQFALNGTRYWADFKPTLYVPDWNLIRKADYIVVVFGILDALTLNKFRYPVVTPTHGHTFDVGWLADYRKPIYVIPDKGEERKVLQMIGDLGWRGKMTTMEFPDGMKDANDFLTAGREDQLIAQLEQVIR